MTRMIAFIAALLMSAVAVSSACVATDIEPLRFTIEAAKSPDKVQIRFKRADTGQSDSWSSSFRLGELRGLDVAALRGSSTRPVRFTIARDAGRLDCAGTGAGSMATGTCTLTPDASFNALLSASGAGQPTREETFGLIALDVKRELVSALREARYPTPTAPRLMELSAVGVTPAYVSALAAQGYRPSSLQGLVEFGALKITPDYVGSFIRAGYSNLRSDELVQLKALNVTADYVAGFDRLGYGRLPVSTLVQLKALNVTPEFVRAVQKEGALPSPDRLIMLRAVGRDLHR